MGILGPLKVVIDGRQAELTAGRQRTLLAVLAMSAGQSVSMERIAQALWESDPPDIVRGSVQTYVTRLRAALAGVQISAGPAGYVLHTQAEQVDALRFVQLLDTAAGTTDPSTEQVLLKEALLLWRGTPFGGVPSDWLARTETPRLVERRLAAVERYVDLRLAGGSDTTGQMDAANGRCAELVAQLREFTTEHPLRETLWVRLLTLLQRCGRSAEALEQYASIRTRLVDELGADPGPELQRVYADLLAGQTPAAGKATPRQSSGDITGRTGKSASSDPPGRSSPAQTRPRQLPAPPQMFTGRIRELAALDQIQDADTVVINAIDGMAGIGKTALAVHTAHLIADRYPGGQLFIDLHGHTQGMDPVEPVEALERMLGALGIPGSQIPAGLEERAALYRTRLADQRVLILLDNAATEAQVAPLLPGAPGCLALVTSRSRLTGLDHTRTLSLDALPTPDAVRLFIQTTGDDRLDDQPAGLLVELVEMCGRLPLAIRIAAARLRSHPTWRLPDLIERLRDQRQRLGELEAGQRSVTTALDLSYQHLSADLQQLYRLLGRYPGVDIDPYAAAALLDSTVRNAGRMLDQLLDVHLLIEPVVGRYTFHDLVRAHAAQLAAGDQSESAEHAALDRLLDFHRYTASLAMDVAYPSERVYRPQVHARRVARPDLTDPTAALRWLDTELPNLLAVTRYATEHRRPAHVLHMSASLHRHLRNSGRYHDAETLHRQALTTSRATGDQAGELDALTGLGHVHRLLDQHERAVDHFGQALRIARAIGGHACEPDALVGLGHISWVQGQYAQAADHFDQALRIARAGGHRTGEMDALIGLGSLMLVQSRHEQAVDHFGQALRIARATGNQRGELNVRICLGVIERLQGRYALAADHFEQAARLSRATGNRNGEMNARIGLSNVERLQGRHAQAANHYQEILELARESCDRNFEFEARQGLGRLQCETGDPDAAIVHHDLALTIACDLGQPVDQARAHDGLAHAYHTLDQHKNAREHWQDALDILTDLGINDTDDEEATAAAIRAHLAASDRD